MTARKDTEPHTGGSSGSDSFMPPRQTASRTADAAPPATAAPSTMSKRFNAAYRTFFGGGGGGGSGGGAATTATAAAGTGAGAAGRGAGYAADTATSRPAARQPSEKHRGGGGGHLGHQFGNPAGKQWFNPEDFTTEKRAWVAMQKANSQGEQSARPVVTSPFEYFLVAGLPTTADVSGVAATAKAAKAARQAGAEVLVSDPKAKKFYRGTSGDTFPAQILFSYPPAGPPA